MYFSVEGHGSVQREETYLRQLKQTLMSYLYLYNCGSVPSMLVLDAILIQPSALVYHF